MAGISSSQNTGMLKSFLSGPRLASLQGDPSIGIEEQVGILTRFSFVVRAGQRIEPYPLNPDSADRSAVADDIRLTSLPLQS